MNAIEVVKQSESRFARTIGAEKRIGFSVIALSPALGKEELELLAEHIMEELNHPPVEAEDKGGNGAGESSPAPDGSALLWRASRWKEVPPEPVAVLTYGTHRYEIPYTLMHWITGWLAMGMHGTFAPCDACRNTAKAFNGIRDDMMRDAAVTQNTQGNAQPPAD